MSADRSAFTVAAIAACTALAAVLATGGAVRGQGATSPAAGPVGLVETIEGKKLTGSLAIDGDGKVTVSTASGSVTMTLDEVTGFVPDTVQPANTAAPHRVWLRSGQQFAARSLRGIPAADGRPARLGVELSVGAVLELPLGTLRAVRHAGEGRVAPASFGNDLDDAPDNRDFLYVQRDGEQRRFQVTIAGMQADKVQFRLRDRELDYPLSDVLGIVFGNNTGFAADEQAPPRVAVDFDTGDHLEGRLLGLGESVRLRLDEGCDVVIPSRRLARLAVASDRLRWLSDFEPTVEQTPAFDRVWPWTVDRSVAGPGFQLAGETFGRGIGMVPRTLLTFDLGGEFDVFEATIGIDDRGGPQAHAVFRVHVDGKVAFESDGRTRGMTPERVRLELDKAKTLALEVDFGKNYDLGDYCAFAEARVLRR